jgi:hypothetical protein
MTADDRPEIQVEISDATVAALVTELDHARYHLERFRSIEITDPAFAEMIGLLADGMLAEVDANRKWLTEDIGTP